jgi:beta-galactosidase
MKKLFFPLLILTLSLASSFSQNSAAMDATGNPSMQQIAPMIGAEIFIEPGQTAEEIDSWYRLMKENGMTICRIRMFETYMHREDGTCDFSLFDLAYKAAEKYNVKVWGNLFPATSFTDVGGFKFPHSDEHLKSVAEYIKNLVTHFKQFKSCYGWVLINDPGSHLHVNNHAIFQNVAEYNFPAWRKILTSLGGSSHASWHFGYFNRSQYSVALSANCEIIRSGAGPLPWLMTEIQGGNNTYSGFNAMCPTREEIDQWLWTVIASGGKGAIFWTFNPRASGFEAGEWAMIDFQNKPSDRLTAASSVAKVISANNSLFAAAKPVESGINILYARESLQTGGDHYEGRDVGGVMKSALSYFEALGEMGMQSNLKEIDEFDFTRSDFTGTVIILAHQVSIPSRYWKNLDDFVSKGGKLIADGLTAYYDEHAHCIMKTGFPLEKLFGADIREFKLEGDLFEVSLNDPSLTIPGHCWRGTMAVTTAKAIGFNNQEIIATRNVYGKGEVLWIPSLIGLAGRIQGYAPLSALLNDEVKASISSVPLRFKVPATGMLMKTLQSGNSYITVIINKSTGSKEVELVNSKNLRPSVLFSDKTGRIDYNRVSLAAEETIVIQWK